MKDELIEKFSTNVSKNTEKFLKIYTDDKCVFKNFVYFTMKAKRNPNDRSLANSVYEQLLKIPEERREKITQLIVDDLVNYIIHMQKNYPVAIIDVNNECNLNCENCAYKVINSQNNINWSLDEINYVIKELRDYTRLFAVAGGEPFINQNLIDGIKKNDNVCFITFTNGTMKNAYERIIKE